MWWMVGCGLWDMQFFIDMKKHGGPGCLKRLV